jgi:hypothetical protein
LNLTVPAAVPKFAPAITIDDPTAPLLGVKLVIVGGGVTVNATPVLATPPAAVTTTFPVAAPAGTVTFTSVPLQLLTVAGVPFNVTAPLP